MPRRFFPFVAAVISVLLAASSAEAVGVGIGDQTDPQPMQYRIEGGPLRDLEARFKPQELAVLEKLNRADVKHLSRLESMVVPFEWRQEADYSPFPQQYAPAAALPKVLIVDQPSQAFAAYEFGQLRDTGADPRPLQFRGRAPLPIAGVPGARRHAARCAAVTA